MGGVLIEPDRTMVVLVDVQDEWAEFLDAPTRERFLFEVERLVRFAQLAGIPVVWAEHAGLGSTPEALRALLSGQEPVLKTAFSCFRTEELAAALEKERRDTLVVAGAEAHVCVLQTALDALARGYAVHVVADAVASRAPLDRETALVRMSAAGATVSTVEMTMFELMGRSDTDLFASVLASCPPWPDAVNPGSDR